MSSPEDDLTQTYRSCVNPRSNPRDSLQRDARRVHRRSLLLLLQRSLTAPFCIARHRRPSAPLTSCTSMHQRIRPLWPAAPRHLPAERQQPTTIPRAEIEQASSRQGSLRRQASAGVARSLQARCTQVPACRTPAAARCVSAPSRDCCGANWLTMPLMQSAPCAAAAARQPVKRTAAAAVQAMLSWLTPTTARVMQTA